ncbi:hypothetical protein GCM10010832_04390 [Psychroflexus planctonicus]|uniref:Secretion system C-terminal sorting domain-containing protein n=2 Tax=Psychroflexus planctonicus TaxID=1526575 RepID=A0ABQ1SD49_9FLAO|nr:hypothetical protein GCM10010832_04390 [Psychroflexus planctonicus]
MAIFSTSISFGQELGDLRSRQNGNWTNASTWEEWNGSSWSNTSTQPASLFEGNIEIRHTVYTGSFQTFWIWTYPVDAERRIEGDLKISSGTLQLTQANSGDNLRTFVSGDFTITGGALSFYGGTESGSSTNAGVLAVDGNVNLLGGNIVSNSIRLPSGIYFTGDTTQTLQCNINLSSQIINRFYLSTGHLGISEIYGGTNVSTVYGTTELIYSDTQTWPTSGNLLQDFTVQASGVVSMTKSREINAALNLNSGVLDVSQHSLKFSGNTFFKKEGKIRQQDSEGELNFANQSLISIPDETFEGAVSNFTISQSGGIKMQSDLSISRSLNLNAENSNITDGLLDMVINYGSYAQVEYGTDPNFADSTQPFNNLNSYILYMGENASTNGIGDVTGKVKRNTIVNNKTYDFGNSETRISFNSPTGASGLPESMLFTITRGDYGEHVDNLGEDTELFLFDENTGNPLTGPRSAVKRLYQIQYAASVDLPGSTRFTLRMAYQPEELNTNSSAELITWDHHLPYNGITPHEHGKTANNLEENWIELSNHSVLYLTKEGAISGAGTLTKYWMLSEKETIGEYVWVGATDGGSSNWNVVSNWSGSKIPNETSDVYIPSSYNFPPIINENSGYGDGNQENPGIVEGEVRMRTIEIAPDAELMTEGAPDIYMYGGPNYAGGGLNYGTFNILGSLNSSESTFYLMDGSTSSEATLNGNLKFYNLVADENANVKVQSNTEIEIVNNLSIPATANFNAVTNPNTIYFTGKNQNIPNPGTVNVGYYNMVLNGNNSTLPSNLNVKGDLVINEQNLNFNTTQVVFDGNTEQFILSDSLVTQSLKEVVINNESVVKSDIKELRIDNLQLTSGTFEAGINNKVVFENAIVRNNGILGGMGTFEFLGPNEIENNLFLNNRSSANITLNKNTTTTTTNFSIPNNFAVDANLHLENGIIPLGTNTLELGGNLSANLGRLNASNAEIVFSGNTTQALSGNAFSSNLVKDIAMTGSGTYQLESPVKLTGVLRPNSGVLNSNANLVFKSSQERTAVVGEIGAGADITGSVQVERFIPARRAFRFLNPTITSTQTIHQNWQEGATAYNDNPNPGYGTHITGTNEPSPNPSSADGQNGFDWNPSGNPSLFYFDNINQSWNPVTNTDQNVIEANVPYRLLVRGSRAIDIASNAATPDNTVLRSSGTLNKNIITHSDNLNNAFQRPNFIGNPYQAPVDLALVIESSINVNNFVQIWDPNIGGANPIPGQPGGRGAFTTIDVANNTTSNEDSDANRFLQPGQAAFFYAINDEQPFEIVFQENHKAVDTPQTEVFSTESPDQKLAIQLYDKASYLNGNTSLDAVLIRFASNFNENLNVEDALKLENIDENFARIENGKLISIEQRALPTENEALALFVNQYRHQEYVFQVDATSLPENTKVFLEDNYLNEIIDLENLDYTYEFSVDESINASKAFNRFSLVFEEVSLNTTDFAKNDFVIYPNPIVNNQFQITSSTLANETAIVSIFDLVGKQVFSKEVDFDETGNKTFKEINLKTGLYLMQVHHKDFQTSKKIIVK